MKITKWVDIPSQEVEIEIGLDDIRIALSKAFGAALPRNDENDESPTSLDVMLALASIGSFLRALTDEQIATLMPSQRVVIATFLAEQAKRFEEVI